MEVLRVSAQDVETHEGVLAEVTKVMVTVALRVLLQGDEGKVE
jgi:hypothetical protein